MKRTSTAAWFELAAFKIDQRGVRYKGFGKRQGFGIEYIEDVMFGSFSRQNKLKKGEMKRKDLSLSTAYDFGDTVNKHGFELFILKIN